MRTCKRCRFDRLSQKPDWKAGMPHLRVRRSGRRAVPGRTLERGKGRNQVAASIKEQDCDRQINKIYRDKMVAYLSSFYGRFNSGRKYKNGSAQNVMLIRQAS